LHDVNFDWGEDWRALIDLEAVLSFLDELFRSRFRLDHMFCVDVLISSEALVHGTCVVPASGMRRAVFARYMNNHSYFRKPSGQRPIHALPATPNHAARGAHGFHVDRLTSRHRQLVVEPAYARGHLPEKG